MLASSLDEDVKQLSGGGHKQIKRWLASINKQVVVL